MSKIREQIKEEIRSTIINERLLAGITKYRLGTCTSVNDQDGTCLVILDGTEITAFPLYPVVLGQSVVLVFGDVAGKVSAIPIRPNTPASDLIHPPYFTGGRTRVATIHQVGGLLPLPPTAYQAIDFQDQGDPKVYRLSFPDLPSKWLLISAIGPTSTGFSAAPYPGVTFSADGTYVCVALYDGTQFESGSTGNYKLRLYEIGAKMQYTTVLDNTNNVYAMKATLISEYNGIYNNVVSLVSAVPAQFVNYQEINFPVDTFVSDEKKLYWLEEYSMVFFSTGGVSMGTPLNLFTLPTTGAQAESLCTLYYIKRLDPGGIGTIVSVILSISEPGPTAFQTYNQFSPTGILDITDDLHYVRVYGALSISGGLPYTTLAVAVMDKLSNPVWANAPGGGGWITLVQTPATQYQTAYTVSYTTPMAISFRVMNVKYSCLNYEDTTATPVFARMIEQTRHNKKFSEIIFPLHATISQVLVKTLVEDNNGVGTGVGGGIQFVESYVNPQWVGNMFTAQFSQDFINKANAPQAFTPKYNFPNGNNVASIGFGKNAAFEPMVTWVSF